MDSTNSVTINIADTNIVCGDFELNKDRHSITISMSVHNIGPSDLIINVNHFCVIHELEEVYAQHCYINDGHSFELKSGCKSLLEGKSYTLIKKYLTNPNLPTYQLCYKSPHKQFVITTLT